MCVCAHQVYIYTRIYSPYTTEFENKRGVQRRRARLSRELQKRLRYNNVGRRDARRRKFNGLYGTSPRICHRGGKNRRVCVYIYTYILQKQRDSRLLFVWDTALDYYPVASFGLLYIYIYDCVYVIIWSGYLNFYIMSLYTGIFSCGKKKKSCVRIIYKL